MVRVPQIGDDVLEIDKEQSEAINELPAVIEDLKDKDIALQGEIDTLKKDYIVDYGSNANGSWEKWASGKMVQWGNFISGNMNEDTIHPLPLRFVGDEIDQTLVLSANRAGGYNNIFVQGKGFVSDKSGFIYRVGTTGSTTTGTVINFNFIGTWK